ncbi:MAG: 2-dehydro-3-deoxygalactonokinase [Alphaproteobacteria bacterium]|nr:2-dehydro-3-deoxygalactonokinase [Alphaproteobacteria bacterium]
MKPFISLDWGTTSFRAYEVNAQGGIINEAAAPEGILAVKDNAFEATLEKHIGGWSKALPIVASGMITSRQGWVECAYAECPAGASDLARAITRHTTSSGRAVHFITGLHYASPSVIHDVIRGEETQVLGSLATGAAHFITRGTHCKWIDVANGKVTGFATYMTGESFALYRQHSILGRLMQEAPEDEAAFRRGVEKSLADPAGLLHDLFSVRTLGLFNELPPTHLASYLSGLLIGSEVAHATSSHGRDAKHVVLGSPAQAATCIAALKLAGLQAEQGSATSAISGQRIIAHEAGVL